MSVLKRWNGTSWEIIGPQISSTRFDDTNHMIAPEYSPNNPYSVGDYVVQSDKLYKCISAIESAEEWTAAHWTQVLMGEEVSDLNNALKTGRYDINFEYTLTQGNAIISNGAVTFNLDQKYVHSNYIDMNDIALTNRLLSVPAGLKVLVRTFDKNDNTYEHISTVTWMTEGNYTLNQANAQRYFMLIIVKENNSYITIAEASAVKFYHVEKLPMQSDIEQLQEDMQINEDTIGTIHDTIYNSMSNRAFDLTEGGYINWSDGTDNSGYNNGFYSDFVTVLPGMTILFNNVSTSTFSAVIGMAFYSEKSVATYIDGISYNGTTDQISIPVPANAHYMRFTVHRNNIESYSVVMLGRSASTVDTSASIIDMYDKVIFIGDSLTYSQVYTSLTDSRQAFSTYPEIIGKMCNITDITYAKAGASPIGWWAEFGNVAFNDHGLYIVFLGTNGGLTDTIAIDCPGTDITQYANTTTGNYGKILQSIVNNADKAILVLPYAPVSGLETTISVINQFAARYNFPVISVDIADRTNVFYHYYPDKTGSNTLHFNDLGYAWLAKTILYQINSLSIEDKFKIMRTQE